MPSNQPSVGEFAVLGILAQRSMHGYEMAHCFEHEDLCEVYPIEQSMLYTHVRKLEERGLISGAEERVGQRPPRKTYSLSETGTESLRNWLGEPVERMRQVRVEFLMKLYFLHAIDPAWQGPEFLPTLDEFSAPLTWLARVDGATVATR